MADINENERTNTQERLLDEQAKRVVTEAERDAAQTVAAEKALERDAALETASAHAVASRQAEVERNAALNAAAIQAAQRREAEAQALDARVAANQAQTNAAYLATERNV